MNVRKMTLLSTAAALTLMTGAIEAAVITPTAATSTTQHDGVRPITNTINSSGLSGGGTSGDILSETHAGGATSSNHWLSSSSAGGGSTTSATEVLTFDLGGTFDVDTIYLWAYNRPEKNRGIKTFNIAFSTDGGGSFGTAVSAASLGMGDFVIGTSGSNDSSTVQTRTITTQTGVTDIQLTGLTTHGSTGFIAISEIRFGAVPEPGSLALLGLGGLLIASRRRRDA